MLSWRGNPPFFMKYPPELRCQCEVAAACGMNFSEIAKAFDINKSTVRFWLRPRAYAQSKKRQKERYYENQEKEQERSRQWKQANPEKVKATARAWERANPERARQTAAAWVAKNQEKLKELRKKYYWQDPQKARAVARHFYGVHKHKRISQKRDYYERNRAACLERSRRRTRKLRHFPVNEIEKKMIQNYYIIARELTQQTGIPHEVDHIWPIAKGGPHLPWNLQVLTAEENRKKRDLI